jgi:hypothetical protein
MNFICKFVCYMNSQVKKILDHFCQWQTMNLRQNFRHRLRLMFSYLHSTEC